MAKRVGQTVKLSSIDELLGVPDTEGTVDLDVLSIYPFENHPFKVIDDETANDTLVYLSDYLNVTRYFVFHEIEKFLLLFFINFHGGGYRHHCYILIFIIKKMICVENCGYYLKTVLVDH